VGMRAFFSLRGQFNILNPGGGGGGVGVGLLTDAAIAS
jgi:hypothetical protein